MGYESLADTKKLHKTENIVGIVWLKLPKQLQNIKKIGRKNKNKQKMKDGERDMQSEKQLESVPNVGKDRHKPERRNAQNVY